MAAVDDGIQDREWRDLADTVLIFVCLDTLYGTYLLIWFQDGLFAAFLSAFLVFLIPQLQPNSADVAVDVLIHISKQLSNSTTPEFESTAFHVSSNIAAVHMLFFVSLALVLIDAFLAMLVKGWLREFDRGWRKCTVASLRARERERRLQALERWKVPGLVALLPILIEWSLFLFCIGLLVLIFPLHLPSAILCSIAFVTVVGLYSFTTYVSIMKDYAPFSSPVSRLLKRFLAILHPLPPPLLKLLPPPKQQADADYSHGTTQPLPSNSGMAKPVQPHNPDGTEPPSPADLQTHVHILERLVTETPEAGENIPIFLELLDQPVKYRTVRPLLVETWRKLLHLGLLRDHSTISVSAACTLARTMMICYNHETADQQLCLTLQDRLGSKETDDQRLRMPLNVLFSSCLRFRFGDSDAYEMCRAIAFLEPSDAGDAELFWMVNTCHRSLPFEDRFYSSFQIFVAVLTYVSSTEQSRRSRVPLTAAVICAMRTIRLAKEDKEGVGSIRGLCLLPGTVSPGPMHGNFCWFDGNDALDLWSEDCIQCVKDLLQWRWPPAWHNDLQLSLIAALYIDSTKQDYSRSTFADLVQHASITDVQLKFSGAYDHGKLAVYWYMAVSKKPLHHQGGDHFANLHGVIKNVITEHSTLQVSGLHILEMAVNYVHKTPSPSSDWLKRQPSGWTITTPGKGNVTTLRGVDSWVLFHLETLLALQPYLLQEEVRALKWSDTPERVHIAKARLVLYDSLAKAGREGAGGPKPHPELLRMFLWSKDYGVCTHAFKWCLDLVVVDQSIPPGDADSTSVFIPETMGYKWVEHFVSVLCEGENTEWLKSWEFLISFLVPKWAMLPSSWRCDFASAFLCSIFQPLDMYGHPGYEFLADNIGYMIFHAPQAFLPLLASMLELTKSSLALNRLNLLEHWLAQQLERPEYRHQDAHTQIAQILTTRRQELV